MKVLMGALTVPHTLCFTDLSVCLSIHPSIYLSYGRLYKKMVFSKMIYRIVPAVH